MRRLFLAAAAAALLLGLTACTAASGTTGAAQSQDSSLKLQTVTASERNIISVLVVPGTVVANPKYVLPAPTSGAIRFTSSSRARSQAKGSTVATVGGTELKLPVRSLVTERTGEDGQIVAKNSPVAVATYSGFGIPVEIPATELYRVYSQPTIGHASVTGGPAGVACVLEPLAVEPESSTEDASGSKPVICLLPFGANVVAELPAQVGIQTAVRRNVIALPVSAVAGSTGEGQVTIQSGKALTTTDVRLGITDGAYVEIRSGIKLGQKVVAYAPGLQ